MCGQKSSKAKHETDQVEFSNIINAIHVFCAEHNMQAVSRSIKQDVKTGKWSIKLKSIMDNSPYSYEMFVHTESNCAMINKKSLYGAHFMPYEEKSKIDDVVGFLYESEGNLEEFYRRNSSIPDDILGHIFLDVVAAVIDLHHVRKVHLKLNFENVEVVKDQTQPNFYHAKLNALEYVIRRRNLDGRRLAPLAHRPPEIINWGFLTQVNLCKAHSYILGSLLFTLLTNKYMGGETFQPLKDKQNAGNTYDNIKKNSPRLDEALNDSRLSSRFRNLLREMLEIDPEKRACLNHVYSSLSTWNPPSSIISGPCLCVPAYSAGPSGESLHVPRTAELTESQIDRLSIITNDLSVKDEQPIVVQKSFESAEHPIVVRKSFESAGHPIVVQKSFESAEHPTVIQKSFESVGHPICPVIRDEPPFTLRSSSPVEPCIEVSAVSNRPSNVSITTSTEKDGESSIVYLDTVEPLKDNEELSLHTDGQGTIVNDVKVADEPSSQLASATVVRVPAPKTKRKKYGWSKIPTKIATMDDPRNNRRVRPKVYTIDLPRSPRRSSKRQVQEDDDIWGYDVQINVPSSSSELSVKKK